LGQDSEEESILEPESEAAMLNIINKAIHFISIDLNGYLMCQHHELPNLSSGGGTLEHLKVNQRFWSSSQL
jgi:hypothetical protein